ncbi:MAG: DUF3667 domain-containing protein [Caulobacteraceae bacterium]|nr:DUF3667 domain-containing protein [Caulobacteraceae bacterium]
MPKEMDLAGLASAGGWLRWRRKHADLEPGTPCMNCETPLQGTYCHNCGQLAESFHKSVWHLFAEALESFFHWDGRLWRTLPPLIYKPGELTGNYINGKRAYQVPPLRLFLVLLVIVFFAGQYGTGGHGDAPAPGFQGPAGAKVSATADGARAQARRDVMADKTMTEADRRVALAAIDNNWATFGGALADSIRENSEAAMSERAAKGKPPAPWDATQGGTTRDRIRVGDSEAGSTNGQIVFSDDKTNPAVSRWFEDRARAIQQDPKRFWMIIENWAHRIAVLALPISALILTLLFVFQRRFYVYDHLIFSMHSLSFQLLLLSTLWILGRWFGAWVWFGLLLSPAHLFVHMRGTYKTGIILTLVRMFFLFIFTTFAFSGLALLLFYLGFNDMGPAAPAPASPPAASASAVNLS